MEIAMYCNERMQEKRNITKKWTHIVMGAMYCNVRMQDGISVTKE